MSKNFVVLSVIAVILGAVYIYAFTDLFYKPTIQIIPVPRPGRVGNMRADPGQPATAPMSFNFDGKYEFTSVKVVSADDVKTNKYPTPLWHLVADTKSIPTRSLVYGVRPKGMKPAVPRSEAMPLLPDTEYIVMIEAGKLHSQTSFFPRAQPGAQ